jgi:integrase
MLTDLAIKSAKPREAPYKMGDSGGLYLQVTPTGGKLWRLKYRIGGKEKKLSLGAYPAIDLPAARKARDAAKDRLAEGKDPALIKQREKAADLAEAGDTFSAVATDYFDFRQRDAKKRWAPATMERAKHILGLLLPSLGTIPVRQILPLDVLNAVRKIERRGTQETARRALQLASVILRHGVATAKLDSDPTRDIKDAVATAETKHFAAITKPAEVGELLRAIDGYQGLGFTRHALLVQTMAFLRPGELRQAQWKDIDWEAGVWWVPDTNAKMRKAHVFPMARQVVELLREVHAITGPTGYIFPSVRTITRPMSENTLNGALRRLGYTKDQVTSHGFRTTASTLLNESGKWNPDAIERALAHGDSNAIRGIYNRSPYWAERVAMMQWWADHLDTLRTGADVVPIRAEALV